jgi:hypothetical protein
MDCLRSFFFLALITSYLLVPTLIAAPKVLLADKINEGVFALDSAPYNMTYEDWIIKFWQYISSLPRDRNPVTDETGEHCGEDQGSLNVFFLAFSSGGGAARTCDIPGGKGILIPVNVVACTLVELGPGSTEEDLHTCAREDESSNPGLFLSVDGREFRELEKYRVHSRAFDITLPNDPFFGVPGPTRAVADGYWIILEPLSPGQHDIHFKATLNNPETGMLIYSDDLKYTVNVSQPSSVSQ